MIYYILITYFIIISLFTIVFTVKDKKRAIKNEWRVKEKTLFILALLGGGLAEYLTMKAIRHKTKHKRFMIGLPVIMILQLAIALYIYYLLK